jgi:hypothetical protein
VDEWLKFLLPPPLHAAPQTLAQMKPVWTEIEDEVKSFNGLRSHLRETFGIPLEQVLLPKATKGAKTEGLSQALYRLSALGAVLQVIEAAEPARKPSEE